MPSGSCTIPSPHGQIRATRPKPARPFSGNIIPKSLLSNSALLTLQKYYPLPNLGVGPDSFSNPIGTRPTEINSDQFGIKLDHRFSNNDTLFGRFNYANPTQTRPQALPTYSQSLKNQARSLALGYTHLLGPGTLLTLHYGYVYTDFGQFDEPAGVDFLRATNFYWLAPVRNGIPIANQLSVSQDMTSVAQFAIPLGPQRGHTVNADLSTVKGKHTFGAGIMYYHIHNFDDGWVCPPGLCDATAIDGFVSQTGLRAASFMMGLPDSLGGFLGDTSANFTGKWYGAYLQDKWQVSRKLTLNFGLRYDFVAPVKWKNNKVSALDVDTGSFLIPVAFLRFTHFQRPGKRYSIRVTTAFSPASDLPTEPLRTLSFAEVSRNPTTIIIPSRTAGSTHSLAMGLWYFGERSEPGSAKRLP